MAISPARAVRAIGVCTVAGLAAGFAAPADAAFELQIDLNSLTATYTPSPGASGAFSTNASGSITLTDDANSVLAGLKADGVDQPTTASLAFFSGTIDLFEGSVVGGSLDVILSDGSRYLTSILSGTGAVVTQAGQGFAIDGLSFPGAFFNLVGGTSFGGVDVTDIGTVGTSGTFFTFAFKPDAQGVDMDTDIDIWVVPSPTGVALFGAAGGLLAVRRRRD